jgi:tRNA 2-thiouridine synthesizing protein A
LQPVRRLRAAAGFSQNKTLALWDRRETCNEEVTKMMRTDRAAQTLDMKGMNGPMPLIWARNMMEIMEPGETIEVLATDPGTIRDFKVYAKSAGHELIDWSETRGLIKILLKKGAD